MQSPIESENIQSNKLFSVPDSNYFPIKISEFNSKYYVMGYDNLISDKNFNSNVCLFNISNDFKIKNKLFENKFKRTPKGFLFNENIDSIFVVVMPYLIHTYNLNNGLLVNYFEFPFNQGNVLFRKKNYFITTNLILAQNIISLLNPDFTFQEIFNVFVGDPYGQPRYSFSGNYDYNENMLISFFSSIYANVEHRMNPSKTIFHYYVQHKVYWTYFEIVNNVFNIKANSNFVISAKYVGDDSEGERNAQRQVVDMKSTCIVNHNKIAHLIENNHIFIFKRDSIYLSQTGSKDINASCIFSYNDSLFLAGGSINGKATLFFLSTENLEIKKTITINSLFGNITSIERASDGEFLLLAENKINKKFDSFLAIKTKNLGKDAYPVSVDLGNEEQIGTITNTGKYIEGNSLIINYDKELSSNTILELYDLMGQKIVSTKQFKINSNTKQVICDLSQFENSIVHNELYFYILKDSNQIQRGKFMR